MAHAMKAACTQSAWNVHFDAVYTLPQRTGSNGRRPTALTASLNARRRFQTRGLSFMHLHLAPTL